MEAVVSLLILGILMTTLMTIIRFSMSMTANAINEAEEAQNAFNELIFEEYSEAGGTLTFSTSAVSVTNPNFNPAAPPNPYIPVFPTGTGHGIVVSNSVPGTTAFAPNQNTGGTP